MDKKIVDGYPPLEAFVKPDPDVQYTYKCTQCSNPPVRQKRKRPDADRCVGPNCGSEARDLLNQYCSTC